jgi:outer membrane protein assembly factor BamE (lipoprotein component of BamABCDE complex)
VKKRGLVILGVVVLLGAWLMVVGYEFLQKENARFQKNVKAAKEEQQRCVARNSKYRNYDQFRTSIRLPYTSDLPMERWMHQYDTLHAGMSESEVEIILGAPDYTRCDVSKQGDKFMGSTWMYAVAIPQNVANDNQNSGIQIVFGPDGKLTDKNAMNMQPKASPTPTAAVAATPSQSGTPAQDATPQPTPSSNATPAAVPSATPATSSPQIAPAATATPSPTPQ